MGLVPSVCPSMTDLESTDGGESLLTMKSEIRLVSSVCSMSCLFTFQKDMRLVPSVCPSMTNLESTHGGESLLNMKAEIRPLSMCDPCHVLSHFRQT